MTLSQTKKGRKMPVVSAYDIFHKYIIFDIENPEKLDVSGLFSRECFLEWISTRAGVIKHPALSYQRVLSAHIRGADKRRPFAEPVEAEILRVLRDEMNNPWIESFQHEKVAIGKRGFKSRGFHENLKMLELVAETATGGLQKASTADETSSSVELSIYESSNSRLDQDLNSYYRFTFQNYAKNTTVPWDLLSACLQNYVPLEERTRSIVSMNKRGVNAWTPAVYFYLNQMVDSNDFRFSRTFLFPSVDERFFKSDRPVGAIITNRSKIITHQDENAVNMFKGSLLGFHSIELYASMVSVCFALIGHLPKVFEEGSVWRRDVLLKLDGTRMVCINKTSRAGSSIIIHVQDQSEMFPSVRNNVCFI